MIINLEAVASSPYFAKPNKHTFFEAVKEAIRFAKQRPRHEEANTIFGENETEL